MRESSRWCMLVVLAGLSLAGCSDDAATAAGTTSQGGPQAPTDAGRDSGAGGRRETISDEERLQELQRVAQRLKEESRTKRSKIREETPSIGSGDSCKGVSIEPVFEKKAFDDSVNPIVKDLHAAAMAYHPALAAEVARRANKPVPQPLIKREVAGVPSARAPTLAPETLPTPKGAAPKAPLVKDGLRPKLPIDDGPVIRDLPNRELWKCWEARRPTMKELKHAVSAAKGASMWDSIDLLIDWILGPDPKLVPQFEITSSPAAATYILTAYIDKHEGVTDAKLEKLPHG
ncbi:MAG TPA: hypothetical protein VFB62_00725, partial [Polyangiaceae bacterium]|nr:hypothetical protein [Polyangiaceae bacterium]